MDNQMVYNSINSAIIEQIPFADLLIILDALFETNTIIGTDTVLLVLDVIERRVGKEPSPSLDAAWERIKKECLL